MATATIDDADYAPLPIRPPNVTVDRRADGSVVLSQSYPMPAPWRSIPHLFEARAREHPERGLIARRERRADGTRGDWQVLTYGAALDRSRRLAQWLLDHGFGPDRGVMVLSGPSHDHMLFLLATQMARAPYAPISANYALVGGDFAKLRHVFDLCRPGLVFADDAHAFRAAMEALPSTGLIRVTSEAAADGFTLGLPALLDTIATEAVDASIAAIDPDAHAKTIFTSGSTGKPKAVITTQRMLTTVAAQHDALYIRDESYRGGEAYLSWLPWSHVGGNNITMTDVINDSATLYIDDGKPVPGLFEETIRNLREVHPTEYGSAPIFYTHLVGAMEADAALREGFFSRLRYMSYAMAGLSQDLFDRLQALAVATTGRKIPIVTRYGATETQGMTVVSWPLETVGPIGLPFPGITLKLAPVGDKLEIRAKGDTVTPGYLNDPQATAEAFDEEGFYRTGDAGRFVDPDRPELGIAFDGRISENFKLATGTWVSVGPLRIALIEALAPLAEDIVITGENHDELGALVWPRHSALAALAGGTAEALDRLRAGLAEHNRREPLSSRRIARLLLLDTPPAGDEIAEKGYVNQRAVQRLRADQVVRLHAADPDAGVVVAG